jgi:hypothetical protein
LRWWWFGQLKPLKQNMHKMLNPTN